MSQPIHVDAPGLLFAEKTLDFPVKIESGVDIAQNAFFVHQPHGGNVRLFQAQFGLRETDIPAMWLVDKKGVLRYINAGFDFDKKIERLLAE